MYSDEAHYDLLGRNTTPNDGLYDMMIRNDHRPAEYGVLGRLECYPEGNCGNTAENKGGEYESLQLQSANNNFQSNIPDGSNVALQPTVRYDERKWIPTIVLLSVLLIISLLLTAVLIATGMTILHKQDKIDNLNETITEDYLTVSKLTSHIQELMQLKNCSVQISQDEANRSHANTSSSTQATIPSILPSSCSELNSSSPSGYYWVKSSTGSSIRVYCDMTRACGPITGGWMRVARLDKNQTSSHCPPNMCSSQTYNGLCGRCSSQLPTVTFPVGVTYSKVCGRIIGYLSGSPDAFSPTRSDIVDGIILAYGNPEIYIWTFAAANSKPDSTTSACPCDAPIDADQLVVPGIIGKNYFCDSATAKVNSKSSASSRNSVSTKISSSVKISSSSGSHSFSVEEPLWAGCEETSHCCSFNNPPWFYRELPAATAENIQLKINLNDGRNENLAVQIIDIYVQ